MISSLDIMCEGTDITLKGYLILYRVSQEVSDLGWIDLDFGCSAICPILPGLMREREAERAEQLGKMSGTSKSKST